MEYRNQHQLDLSKRASPFGLQRRNKFIIKSDQQTSSKAPLHNPERHSALGTTQKHHHRLDGTGIEEITDRPDSPTEDPVLRSEAHAIDKNNPTVPRHAPPSTSSSTLVNEEELITEIIRKSKSRRPIPELITSDYWPSSSISPFELPQGVHLHHLPSHHPPTNPRDRPLSPPTVNLDDHSTTQSPFIHLKLRETHHDASTPLTSASSSAPEDQPEVPRHDVSHPIGSLHHRSSPTITSSALHRSPPRNHFSAAHDKHRLQTLMKSPKRQHRPSHQSYIKALNQETLSPTVKETLEEEVDDDDDSEDINQTPKPAVSLQSFAPQALAIFDEFSATSNLTVSGERRPSEEKQSKTASAIDTGRRTTGRLKPPFAHLVGKMKGSLYPKDGSMSLEEGKTSVGDHLAPPSNDQSSSRPNSHPAVDEVFSQHFNSGPLSGSSDAHVPRKSGRQDEQRLKELRKQSPTPQTPSSAVEKPKASSNPTSANLDVPCRYESQLDPTRSTKLNNKPTETREGHTLAYDASVVYKGQLPGGHGSVLGYGTRPVDKLGSNDQPGWPESPFLKPKTSGSDSDSVDSPDELEVAGKDDHRSKLLGQLTPTPHSVRKTVAFVDGVDRKGHESHESPFRRVSDGSPEVPSSPEDGPYATTPGLTSIRSKARPLVRKQEPVMSEESVLASGFQTLSTPKILGFYPATPAPAPLPPHQPNASQPVPSYSNLSTAAVADKRLERLKGRPSESRNGISRPKHLTGQYKDVGLAQLNDGSYPTHTAHEQHHDVSKDPSVKGKGKERAEVATDGGDSVSNSTSVLRNPSQRQPSATQVPSTAKLARQPDRLNGEDMTFDQTHLDISRLTAATPHPPGWFAPTPVPAVHRDRKKPRSNPPTGQGDGNTIPPQNNLRPIKPSTGSASSIVSLPQHPSSQHQSEHPVKNSSLDLRLNHSSRLSTADHATSLPSTTNGETNAKTSQHVQKPLSQGKPQQQSSTVKPDHNANPSKVIYSRTQPLNHGLERSQPDLNRPSSSSTSMPNNFHRSNEITPNPPNPEDQTTPRPKPASLMRTPPRATGLPDRKPNQLPRVTNQNQHLQPPLADTTHGPASMTMNCLSLLQRALSGDKDVDLMNLSLPPIIGGDCSGFEIEEGNELSNVGIMLSDIMVRINEIKKNNSILENLVDSNSFQVNDINQFNHLSSSDSTLRVLSNSSILGALSRTSEKIVKEREVLFDNLAKADDTTENKIESKTIKPKQKLGQIIMNYLKNPLNPSRLRQYRWILGMIFTQAFLGWLVFSLATVRAVNLSYVGYYSPRDQPLNSFSKSILSYKYLNTESSNCMKDLFWFIIDWLTGFHWSIDRVKIFNNNSLHSNSIGIFDVFFELISSYFIFDDHDQQGIIKRTGFAPT
ncbi:hypothetical protein CROQUDRAFT_108410 [Cronartium quercuum f. sp. fusiforme G11]|uniref:Uncharacterized protein n=1 Tax=Cronartium quercuum f. sp. fusiforme G11 TaxID=708437 RepID=A0A9P6TAG6_9BASI|nr:hypothetical protein CROQUDRAFT_108410 [Cronartium quercuum f. sp. fusiforme G11]